jgi:hypothetical protein
MTFGWTDTSNVWRVIDEVYHRGEVDLVRASARASLALREAAPGDRAGARRRGESLIAQIANREDDALESARALIPGDAGANTLIDAHRARLVATARRLDDELRTEHERLCRGGTCEPVAAPLSDEARRLDHIIPVPRPGVHGTTTYFGNYFVRTLGREKLASFKLRSGFDYGIIGYAEARNFMNGHRSLLDIYNAVAAEVWSEGYPTDQAIGLDELERYARMLDAAALVTLTHR